MRRTHRRPTSGGRIIGVYGSGSKLGEAGSQYVVTLNVGKSQGLEIGHVLALVRPGASVPGPTLPKGSALLKLPDERYGTAFVFRVFERVSYALVMQVSRPVNALDLVQNP